MTFIVGILLIAFPRVTVLWPEISLGIPSHVLEA